MKKRERIKLIANVLNGKLETIKTVQQMDVSQLHDFSAAIEKECEELQKIPKTSDPEPVLRQIAQTLEEFGLASPDEFPPDYGERGTMEPEVVDDPKIDELLVHLRENVQWRRNFAKQLEQSRKR